MAMLWKEYESALRSRPLLVKAATAGTFAALADAISQILRRHLLSSSSLAKREGEDRDKQKSKLQWRRIATMFAFGFLYSGPSFHAWHNFMENFLFRHSTPTAKTAFKKMIIDQLLYGPTCNVMAISYITLAVERQTLQELALKLQSRYLSIQLNGWKVWPLASLISFAFIPVRFRVIWANLVALCWSTFLILQAARRDKKITPPPSPKYKDEF